VIVAQLIAENERLLIDADYVAVIEEKGRLTLQPEDWIVGGGEKGYQFGGREGARCGVTL